MDNDPEYAAEFKAKRATKDKEYRESHRKEVNQRMRIWHSNQADNEEYIERKRESRRKTYWNNREKELARQEKWRAENDRSEYNSEWGKANRDKRRESTRRRKALLKGATVIEPFTKQEVWERDNGRCGICLEMADESDWHLDHVIPLSKGGQHTLANVQVSHPVCNLRKKDKILPIE